jgi:hypothetical protein
MATIGTAVLFAYIAADALSALYHLFTDRGWNISSQRSFFENHHRRPWTMTFDLQPLAVGLPIATFGYLFESWFLLLLGMFLSVAQLPHYWAHFPAPWPVRVLQLARIILPPAKHASHHQGDFDRDFCVLSGWNNFWINWFASFVPQRKLA